jgi:hypothetical protein
MRIRRSVVLALLACASPLAPAAALAANCDAVPCHCGDTLTTSRTLTASDPVTTTVCTGTGLIIDGSNLILNVAREIRGLNSPSVTQTGIRVAPGRTGVTVTTARISGFTVGLSAIGVSSSNFTDLLIVKTRGAGVVVSGANNIVQRSEMKGVGDAGVEVAGDGAVVFLNRVELYDTGIRVIGSGADIDRNYVIHNGRGIHVQGAGASLYLNAVKYNSSDGVVLEAGGGHQLDRNTSLQNGGDGFSIADGTGSVLTRNTANYAGGVGFRDTTTGSGTAGTANTYATTNRCTARAGHKSDPPGLCR